MNYFASTSFIEGFFFLVALLLCCEGVAGDELKITNESELVNFVTKVNSGTNYLGTTVLLDSDLSLSGETLEPIGLNITYQFLGTFDGQGHIISDLTISSSSSEYTGLFGYSKGLTIRNVVLDSSCSITSSCSSLNEAYTGGIIGSCNAYSGQCDIENSVNMADVTFSGDTYFLFLGGIAGYLFSYDYSSSYPIYVKNCANYGSVTHSGTRGYSYIGGIVGYLSNSYYKYIYNCLNYGTITHSGTTSYELCLGGVVGYAKSAYIENCVSAGGISSQNTPSKSYIGGIMGYVDYFTYINYCYYTSELSDFDIYGYGTPASSSYTLDYDNATFELSEAVSVGSYTVNSLINALNAAADYYLLRDYSKWLLNKEEKSVSFIISSRTNPITMNSQIILLPNLAARGSLVFDGWYNDNMYTDFLESFEITGDKTLYGRFEENTNKYIIFFDARRKGIIVAPIIAQFGTVMPLPSDLTRDYCSVAFWENEYGDNVGLSLTMPAHDPTLYAVWKCTHIATPEDFIDFSKVVNSGSGDYNDTTVYLDSDLSLSGETLEPIGKDYYKYFLGVFDGQGHIVSDLKINSSSGYYTGLFGYSKGLTIRNVVLDSSCSIINSYGGSGSVYMGGIIGECYAAGTSGDCNIENSVNMADITFSGKTSGSSLYLGGIAGYIIFSSYYIYMKNCANYGTVSNTGTSGGTYLGGIVGYLYGSKYKQIYNCLNYGTITHSGVTPRELNLGGIVGYSYYSTIENCVSSGPIVVDSSSSVTIYVGGIVGYAYSSTNITHCYWNMSIGYGACGYEDSTATITDSHSFDTSTFELAESVSIGNYAGTSLIGALNGAADYYTLRDYSHWALNKDSRDVSFTVNGRSQPSFTTNAQVILLPDLASGGNMSFSGWYTDSACTVPLTDFTIDSDEKKDLYGLWNVFNYTINFDTRGGSTLSSITSPHGSTVKLPTSLTRSGYKFLNWETEYGDPVTNTFIVPSRNITLYGVWLCERITTARELIAFSDAVNPETDFEGTIMYLDSDIDFTDGLSQQFKVIGKYPNFFQGTFNGQGHVIRNLAINASSSYQIVGLFGYSAGTTIQNVVMDETCSFTNNFIFEGYDTYTGGIIGYCKTDDGLCTLENNVNMADVTFNGSASVSFIGGIAGILILMNYEGTIKNCANYGTITDTGKSGIESDVGGIAGSPQRETTSTSRFYVYVQNCANYGTLFYNGTTNKLRIGGVSGYSYYSTIENCVSFGPIIVDSSDSEDKYVGSIVGFSRDTTITHCYWNMSIGYGACGYEDYSSTIIDSHSFDTSSFELAGSVSIGNYAGSSLTGALNGAADYYFLRDYSHWALNKDGRNVSFTVNGRSQPSFTTNTQIILLPDLASGRNVSFSGWYTDSACDNLLADFIIDSDKKKDLYGLLAVAENNYTINFDTRGGSNISSITSPYGSIVELSTSITRSGCNFLNWKTEYGDPVPNSITVPSRNITLYAVWLCEHITTARDLIAFSDAVNSGTNFIGTTVYLDSDIDFTYGLSGRFEVIGKNSNNYFRGTFNGQGHVIRNLTINASSLYQFVGIFGYSAGTTIQNIVIDETCSVVNNFISSEGYVAYAGSAIGVCRTNDRPCIVENNVNMANITFNGNTTGYSYTGGVVGVLTLVNYQGTIKNCANYGTVSSTGTNGGTYLGGIVGYQKSSSSTFNLYAQNCANYGTVFYNGTSNIITIGGISGYSEYNTIDNCVSSGPIIVEPSSSASNFIGSIAGYADSATTITHCYWTLDVGYNGITGYSGDSITVTETTYVEHLNTTTLDELNAYVISHKLDGFNQWVMLHLNGGSVSNLAQSDLVVAQEHFPSPVKEGNTFLRWCKDLECGEVYDNDLTGVTALYAVWKTVRVTFTFWNGTTAGPVSVEYGTAYGALPEAGTVVMEGHTLCWFISNDEGDNGRIATPETIVTIISDHTLHGRWVANNYTVTLDLGNGTVITRTLQYNERIELPQGITREGCTHTGWDNNSNITNMPAMNITISSLWNCTHNSHSSSSSDEPIGRGGDNKSKSSSNIGAIVGGVVGGIIGVIIIVLAVLMLLMFLKKKENNTQRRDGLEMKGTNSRIVEKSLNASEADCCNDNSSSTLSESLSKVYPVPYRVPTIAEGLYMAGLSESKIGTAVESCMNAGSTAANEGKLTDTFGKEDAAAVALYTFDFGGDDYEINPYRIINKALGIRNDEELQKASGLLYLVLSALRKLPRHTGGSLYRGIRGGVDVTSYKEGSTVVWHGLSSTSPDMSTTKAFLAHNATNENDTVKGTLFVIDKGWGYDIQPYSLFPDETEILLEPERSFRVQSVIEAELTIINLEMVDTPVILPEIFGENSWQW